MSQDGAAVRQLGHRPRATSRPQPDALHRRAELADPRRLCYTLGPAPRTLPTDGRPATWTRSESLLTLD